MTKEDFFGSSALALEIAPAATNAWNKSPSIVLWSWVLCFILAFCVIVALANILCVDLQLHTPVSCTCVSNKDCYLFLGSSLLPCKDFVAELGGIDRQFGFSLVDSLSLDRLLIIIPLHFVYFIFA
jgi:hypothetical protein